MTVFNFQKIMPCGKNCAEDFEKEIIKLVPEAIGSINFHITMLHSKPHKIEVVFYDKSQHETKKGNEIISKKFTNPLQTKFTGTLPTLSELENL